MALRSVAAAGMAANPNDIPRIHRLLTAALAIGRKLGARPAVAQIYGMLAELAIWKNDHAEAARYRGEAQSLFPAAAGGAFVKSVALDSHL